MRYCYCYCYSSNETLNTIERDVGLYVIHKIIFIFNFTDIEILIPRCYIVIRNVFCNTLDADDDDDAPAWAFFSQNATIPKNSRSRAALRIKSTNRIKLLSSPDEPPSREKRIHFTLDNLRGMLALVLVLLALLA